MSLSREELQALYVTYGPAVRARCRAICGNPSDADEVLQEAFLRAWRSRRRFDGRHPLAWLQAIARNAALDRLRKRRPWVDDPQAWLALAVPPEADGAALDVGRLLADFGPEDAAILRLRHAESWTILEIAEHFDTSSRTVRRRLQRLERRARALLGIKETMSDAV